MAPAEVLARPEDHHLLDLRVVAPGATPDETSRPRPPLLASLRCSAYRLPSSSPAKFMDFLETRPDTLVLLADPIGQKTRPPLSLRKTQRTGFHTEPRDDLDLDIPTLYRRYEQWGQNPMTLLLDVLGVVLWICVALIVATGLRPVVRRRYPDFTFLANSWLVGVVAILTIALTYGTVRSQLQQTSDNSLQEAGNFFVQAEYDEPTFRCLYDWGAYRQPDECLDRITSSADAYTKAMLYIEEVLYILDSSTRDHKLWKSRYTQDISYWREDVALDPTGMFSWFSVIDDPEDPGAALRRAGVEIDATMMCRNYRKVHAQLTLRGARPDPLIDCDNPPS